MEIQNRDNRREDKFLSNFTDFIFQEGVPEPADAIFIPGNGWPQMSLHAAGLWKQGFAPWIVPSGRFSITGGAFAGVRAMKERYPGPYETEWEFMKSVLTGEGVPEKVILREDQARYTYENAVYSKKVTDAAGIHVRKGLICCQSHHARRCLMYYQLVYPETDWILLPSDTEVNRENWFESERGIRLVLGEIERCGAQFHQILNERRERNCDAEEQFPRIK